MNKKILILTILLSILSFKTSYCMQIAKTEKSEAIQPKKIKMKKQKAYLMGKEYYKLKEYETAFIYFEYSANKENIIAQFETASMLTTGLGCEEDLERALKLTNSVKKRSKLYAAKKKNQKKYYLEIFYHAKELWYDIVTKILSTPREISLDLGPLQEMLQGIQEEGEDEPDSTPHPGMYL